MSVYIFDIDQTIADNTMRRDFAGKEPKRENKQEYDRWLKALQPPGDLIFDKVIPALQKIVEALKDTKSIIYFVTARSEEHRNETLEWLRLHNFTDRPQRVIFRSKQDYRPDEEYKLSVLQELSKQYLCKPVLFDDKPKVCKLLAKHGFPTLQVRT